MVIMRYNEDIVAMVHICPYGIYGAPSFIASMMWQRHRHGHRWKFFANVGGVLAGHPLPRSVEAYGVLIGSC